ncbi:MAG: tetratricopeptide repeat protein [Bdellovibrio bacteriovorus]
MKARILASWLLLALAGLPVAWCDAATGQPDLVAALPSPWDQRLVAIPESDLSGAEPSIRQAIIEARTRIAELLGDPASDPKRLAQAYGRLGALLVLREVEAPADAAFRNARTLEPEAFRWPYYGGYLAMMTGNNDRALELFEAARALDPDYPTLYLRLGKVHLDRSELTEARANFERTAEVPGLEPAARFYLGQIANLERRYADAVALLTKTLELDPNATEAHWPLAQAYRALGEDDKARAHMAQVEPRTPPAKDPLLEQLQGAAAQSVPAFERAIYAVDKRDYETAAAELAAGLEVAPDNLPARVSYARVLYLSGKRDQAAAELDRVLAADPNQTLALFLKGVLLQQAGDAAGAADHYRRALAVEPKHPGVLYYLANLDFSSGRYAEAAKGYRLALQAEDAPPPARLLALLAEHRAGRPEAESAAALAELIAAQPEDPVLLYAQALLLAAASDGAVRDPTRASHLATTLGFLMPGPPQLRLAALSQAAGGDYAGAAATLGQVTALAGPWLPPALGELLGREIAAYREGRLPDEPWPEGDPLLAPPPFDPTGPFRDYPAAVPY